MHEPMSATQIEFGLNNNLEDPSDDEARGFEAGVRYAEFMLSKPTVWEYMLEPQPTYSDLAERRLNELGAEGWQLCAIGYHAFILRRPKVSE